MEDTCNDAFRMGISNEFIPRAKPQVKNISPKKAIETKKFFCSFINLFCNASNDYYYLMNEKTIQNALPSIFLCETPFLSSTAIKQNIAFQQRRQRYEFLC